MFLLIWIEHGKGLKSLVEDVLGWFGLKIRYMLFFFYVVCAWTWKKNSTAHSSHLFIYRFTFRVSFDSTKSTKKELLAIDVCVCAYVCMCDRVVRFFPSSFFFNLGLICRELYLFRCVGIRRKNKQCEFVWTEKFENKNYFKQLYDKRGETIFVCVRVQKGILTMVAKGAYKPEVLNSISLTRIHMYNTRMQQYDV